MNKEETSKILKAIFEAISLVDPDVEVIGQIHYPALPSYGFICMIYDGRPLFHETDWTLEDVLRICDFLYITALKEKSGEDFKNF